MRQCRNPRVTQQQLDEYLEITSDIAEELGLRFTYVVAKVVNMGDVVKVKSKKIRDIVPPLFKYLESIYPEDVLALLEGWDIERPLKTKIFLDALIDVINDTPGVPEDYYFGVFEDDPTSWGWHPPKGIDPRIQRAIEFRQRRGRR